MSSVEERVVRMTFDNNQFGQGISATLAQLDRLNKSLKLEGAAKGFSDVSAASNGLSFDHISNAVDGIANKFKTMSVVAITALTNVVNKAVDAGISLVKSITVAPIMDGFHEYETNLNSIQTILANTGLEGKKGLQEVTKHLDELNHYADQTIYNFSEMARNIGTFTAAGVSLDTSTAAIKGIANLAAVSGSNAQQASTAMYQLSQAIAAGKVGLEDWNSVVNAGMGGKVFQDSLMETARVHGVAIDKMVKEEGSFRMTLQKGWLTSNILTETLSKFTGDLSAAQLKSMGYNDQQIAQIIKMGQTAQDAATKVKTMSQLIGTLQEAVGSGWAQTWQILFGDFEEAKGLFTDVANVLGGFISKSADARNSVLKDWKELGGREALIQSIGNAFHALIAVVTPIKDAFREIFPPTTGAQLYKITEAIFEFTNKLKIGAKTSDELKRTFAGLFAVLDIVWMGVKAGVRVLAELFGYLTKGSGHVLEFTGNIGDFLVGIRNAIKDGDAFGKIFEKIASAIKKPIELLKEFKSKASDFLGGLDFNFDGAKAAKSVSTFIGSLHPLTSITETIVKVWEKTVSVLGSVWNFFAPIAQKIGGVFKTLGREIADSFGKIDYNSVLKGIQTGLFAGLLLLIHQFINKMKGGGSDGMLDGIKEAIEGLTNTLGALQNTLKAATLLEIAVAIGLLAISLSVLSKIDEKALAKSLGAITVLFADLMGSMTVMSKFIAGPGMAQMLGLAVVLIGISIAMDLLTVAIKNLASVDIASLRRGLITVTVLLGALAGAMRIMPPSSGMISTGIGLIALAAGVVILTKAVNELSALSWSELSKGLVGVGALLGSLALFTKFADASKGGVLQGAGIILLATGIRLLVDAVKQFGDMSVKELAKGLGAVGVALTEIGAALYLIPPTAPLSAAGVLIVAASLSLIGDAIAKMGAVPFKETEKGLLALAGALTAIALSLAFLPPTSLLSAAAIFVVAASLGMMTDALMAMSQMSWTDIAQALVLLAGSLGIIAGALYLMTGALPGAAALLVVAASLAILAPILQMFGQMSWAEMGQGLLMLAGVFVVLGLAGLVLAPIVPVILALGAAILLMGAGMLLAGVGILAFSVALTALSVAGGAATAAIVGIVAGLIGLIPLVMEQIGLGLIAFANVIATAGPAITQALVTVMTSLLNAIVTVTPQIVNALLSMLLMLLQKLAQYVPPMVQAGMQLIIGILTGIRNNIQQIVVVALQIITNFLTGLAQGLPQVIDAGIKLIISFVNGIADGIRNNAKAMSDAGINLASAIVEGMVKGIGNGIGKVVSAAKNLAKSALDSAMDFLGINSPSKEFTDVGMYSSQGMAIGLTKHAGLVSTAAEGVGSGALEAIKSSLSGLSDVMLSDVKMEPVISPVLDLTGVQKSAGQLGSMLSSPALSVDTSYSSAKSVSAGYLQAASSASSYEQAPTSVVTFNQFNNSPKALSAAEIYRQTNNQLSIAKGALPKA